MPSDIIGDCQLKLACLVSDTVRLIIIIILEVRESASSRRAQEWISPRLLALVANCDNALNAYLHRRITLPWLWNLSHDAQKERAICYCAVVGRSRIKHVTQKAQEVDRC